jgi:hypothetical protein
MATALAALLGKVEYIERGVAVQEWSATISGVGNPLHAPHLPEKTVHIGAPTTLAGTSRIIIEGSNGTAASTATWLPLTTPTDGLLDFTSVTAGGQLKVIRENPRMIRPHFHTVTTGETLTVRIVAR